MIRVDTDAATAEQWLAENAPGLRVMSAGQAIETYKEAGPPREFIERFALADMQGSHALGHTRMATEAIRFVMLTYSTHRIARILHGGKWPSHTEQSNGTSPTCESGMCFSPIRIVLPSPSWICENRNPR